MWGDERQTTVRSRILGAKVSTDVIKIIETCVDGNYG